VLSLTCHWPENSIQEIWLSHYCRTQIIYTENHLTQQSLERDLCNLQEE